MGERTDDDSYAAAARWYDRLIGPFLGRLRSVGIEMCSPRAGMAVLDVGGGTGAQLAAYQKAGCSVTCVDTSEAMLGVARGRLGPHADLREGSGTALPFEDGVFDLVMISLVLHELPRRDREVTVGELRRVVKPDGFILVSDFLPGPYRTIKGRLVRAGIVAIEIAAGDDHWRNHRDFLSAGGIDTLAEAHDLSIRERRELGGRTLGAVLLTAGSTPAAGG